MTVGSLEEGGEWLWIVCTRCMRRRPYRTASLVQRFGRETSSNVILRSMRCQQCKWKRATFQRPSWGGSHVGWAPFPEGYDDE